MEVRLVRRVREEAGLQAEALTEGEGLGPAALDGAGEEVAGVELDSRLVGPHLHRAARLRLVQDGAQPEPALARRLVEHEVVVHGTETHLFCIQHDPGNARYAYMADDIWNITHVGYTRPNPVSIGNVIETLLSLWCLAPVFSQLVGKLDMELIKSHTRVWTEDLIATNPSPKPKPKIVLSKEELEEAGLAVSSDEEEFQDPQEAQDGPEESPRTDRKRHAEEGPSGEEGADHRSSRAKRRTGENDTSSTAPALLGALKAFAKALRETADRIADLAEEQGVDSGITPDHPEAVKMVRLLSRRLNLNQDKTAQQVEEDMFDPKWFPVITIEDENRPGYRG